MIKTNWQNGTVTKDAYVVINGTEYLVQPKTVEGTTPLSADNLNAMENNIEDAIEAYNPVVLFDGDTDGTVTLSDNSANYDYLEVLYRSNNNIYNATKIYQANNKRADLITINYNPSDTHVYIKTKVISISGASISISSNSETVLRSSGNTTNTSTNAISIVRVLGYKGGN